MLKTFEDNLEEATAAEEKAEADFDALMEAKKTQLSTAKQALLDKSGEKGARGEALAASIDNTGSGDIDFNEFFAWVTKGTD